MKIICTKCGLVHTNRATDHLTDRLCCYDTVRLVSFEIEEKLKAEYAKLYPLPCDCGSLITNKEPEKTVLPFRLGISYQWSDGQGRIRSRKGQSSGGKRKGHYSSL